MSSRLGRLLVVLTLLFALRVLGQALVAFFSVPWLPSMAWWYSGLVPYPILLAIQLVMLILMAKITMDILRGAGIFARQRPNWSRFLVGFSALDAGTMALRYILTMLFRPELRWFGHTIPIFFHFVLAGFIFILGLYHAKTKTSCGTSRASS